MQLPTGAKVPVPAHGDTTDTPSVGLTGWVRVRIWSSVAAQSTVHVVLDPGVTGTPVHDTSVAAGTMMAYSYAPAAGYQNLIVHYDGRPVPASGTVRADSTHLLMASADRILTLPSGMSGLYQSARSLLTAADKPAAFQAFVDAATAYGEGLPPAGADSIMSDFFAYAFDPIADSAAMRQLEQDLGGHEFVIRAAPTGTAARRAPAGRRGVVHAQFVAPTGGLQQSERTHVLFVNGILNTARSAYEAWRSLKSTLGSSNPDFTISYLYNPSAIDPNEQSLKRTKLWACLREAWRYRGYGGRYSPLGSLSFPLLLQACDAAYDWDQLTDNEVAESIRQQLRTWAGTPGAEPFSLGLASTIQAHRDSGQHVIVVAHSQGNWMAAEAIRLLRTDGRYVPRRDSSCIGVVSLAAPSANGWQLPVHGHANLANRYDIIPEIDNDAVPRLNMGLTQIADSILAASIGLDVVVRRASFGVQLHYVDTYLSEDGAGSYVREALNSVYGSCAVAAIDVSPSADSVADAQVGGKLFLKVQPLNQFGDSLGARSVTATSSDDSVVWMFGGGIDAMPASTTTLGFHAAALGTAVLHLTVGTKLFDFPVTVRSRDGGTGGCTFPSFSFSTCRAAW